MQTLEKYSLFLGGGVIDTYYRSLTKTGVLVFLMNIMIKKRKIQISKGERTILNNPTGLKFIIKILRGKVQ